MLALPFVHFVGLPTKRQRAAEAARPAARPPRQRTASKPPAAAQARSKLLDGTSFAHLNRAVACDDVDGVSSASRTPERVSVTAEAILAAAAKARSPTGTGAPPMDAFTMEVIRAGLKRRGEIA